jgi:hypothetical protein
MNSFEMRRFAADLKSDPALRAEAERAQADDADGALLVNAVEFACRKGYRFTVDEAKAVARARAKAVGIELGDAELEGPAGGPCWYWSILLVGSAGQCTFDHGRYWSLGPLPSSFPR